MAPTDPQKPEAVKRPAAPAAPAAPVAAAASQGGKHLELLLDVNVSLTLRFGQRDITLREILDLGEGSVIELDRKIEEPADLLLGEKLIARGQVVMVNGNYGIRIMELPSPS